MTPSSLTGAPKDLLDLHNIRLRPQPLPKWKDQGESSQKPGKIIEIVCICQCHMYINYRNRIIYIYIMYYYVYIIIYIYYLIFIWYKSHSVTLDLLKDLIVVRIEHRRPPQEHLGSRLSRTPRASQRQELKEAPGILQEVNPIIRIDPNSNTRWYPIVS